MRHGYRERPLENKGFSKSQKVKVAGESLTLLTKFVLGWRLAVAFHWPLHHILNENHKTFALPDINWQWVDMLHKQSLVGAWFSVWVCFVLNWQKNMPLLRESLLTLSTTLTQEISFFPYRKQIPSVDKTKQLHKT